MNIFRPVVVLIGLCLFWQMIVSVTNAPPYILPGPLAVVMAWIKQPGLFISHGAITALEIFLGLLLGFCLGVISALCMAYFRSAQRWMLPVLVISQAVPVFALAPVLVLWLGYGLASKVTMATLIIFFPVTAAFYDGLRRTEPGWINLAITMNASRWAILRHIRIPAAIPALGTGLRVASAVAPIGAIVGEWVGSSGGLGYLMLHANARVQVDVMFAALLTLALMAVALYFAVDQALRRLVRWQPEDIPSLD